MAALRTNDAVPGDTYTVLKFPDVKALICQAVGGEAALPAAVLDKLNEGVANAVSIRTEYIEETKTVPDIPFSKFKFSIMSGKRFLVNSGRHFRFRTILVWYLLFSVCFECVVVVIHESSSPPSGPVPVLVKFNCRDQD